MISSRSNSRVKLVYGLQTRRKVRQKNGLFVLEGDRLVREALTSGQSLKFLFVSSSASNEALELVQKARNIDVRVEEVSDDVMQYCSATETAPGILAVLNQVDLPVPADLYLAVVADHFSTPGNLGTLLRSAAAAGAQVVFLTEGTVDAYNPKVVRGAMGAHFRLPIHSLPADQIGTRLAGLSIWIAEAGPGIPYSQVNWTEPSAIIIGSEAYGPQPALRDLGDHVAIPLAGGMESLNAAVAGSVILFEIQRQRGLL
ncbi:MAG: RNA methyltransferase [Anaerolineales bacterium]|nr:RNA methyltransferase [Anaerolineales bacterium]